MPVVRQNGLRFHYMDRGSGRPLVFLHGLGGSIDHACTVLNHTPNVRAVSLDMRGHGRTGLGPPSQLNFQQFAEDVAGLMDHLRIDRAVVGGISMGAGVSLKLALSFPERVEGLILVRPAWTHEGMARLAQRLYPQVHELIQVHGPLWGRQEFLARSRASRLYREQPAALSSLLGLFRNKRATGTSIKYFQMAHDRPLTSAEELSSLTMPTLVVGNTHDFIHPAEFAQYYASHIPGAVLRYITSRSISRTRHQQELVKAVNDFLAYLPEKTR